MHPSLLFCRIDGGNDPSVEWLKKLDGSLKWEARSLILPVVAVPVRIIYPPAALLIGAVGIFLIMIMVSVIEPR